MARNAKDTIPSIAIHPGKLLSCELQDRGIHPIDFAVLSGIQPSIIRGVIKEEVDISVDLASKFEKALGIPSSVWINLQRRYDIIAKASHQTPEKPMVARQNSIPFSVNFNFNGVM